ncbi:DUF3291 domain-containing protein [Cytobacillus firmus]|uniref:DUF3291 domain-containing protein n=1 Tax=Cytobacillus firmus TaxID=1399 RepID=UPI0018CF1FA7|nr:DUF3291 domain-containing protein [Cytobacillus firmus]MBG9586291.1 hypothetical protein [Cytobacillus firmus]
MAFAAILTVGQLKHSEEHPASREFFIAGNYIMREAAKTGQLVKEFNPNRVKLPEEMIKGNGTPVLTLTVWKDLQSLYRFTYSGLHRQALQDRNKWFDPLPERQPNYVIWWSDMLSNVSWKEAFKRYDSYIQHGPDSFAFDFKHPFDEFGEPVALK